jgi:hypothetical protein
MATVFVLPKLRKSEGLAKVFETGVKQDAGRVLKSG